MTDMVTLTDADGNKVDIPANLVFGEAGDEKPIPFAITGEIFYAAAAIPADDHGTLSSLFHQLPKATTGPDGKAKEQTAEEVEQTIHAILNMVELFLLPESAARLADRLKSKERPVDIAKLMRIVSEFLTNVYAAEQDGDGRPTKPTSA